MNEHPYTQVLNLSKSFKDVQKTTNSLKKKNGKNSRSVL